MVLPARGLTGLGIGVSQAEKPMLGKEGIGPPDVVGAAGDPRPAVLFARDVAQPQARSSLDRVAISSIGDTDKDSAMPGSIQQGRSANHTLRIVCPNGHLGFAPIKTGSFRIGCHCEPDLICADSGSCDVGPVPLGADISSSPLQWQVDDLEAMLLASRRLGVPLIVGSAGDTGTNSRVDRFVGIIRELAKKHGLARFRIGYFYSEVETEALRRRIVAGAAVAGLDGRPSLDLATPDATARGGAVARLHPPIKPPHSGIAHNIRRPHLR